MRSNRLLVLCVLVLSACGDPDWTPPEPESGTGSTSGAGDSGGAGGAAPCGSGEVEDSPDHEAALARCEEVFALPVVCCALEETSPAPALGCVPSGLALTCDAWCCP